jgi:RES domain-containing protein
MLDQKKLGQALRQLKGTSKQGPFSRCVGYQHLATVTKSGGRQQLPQPLWGLGSKRFGGRFTPKNSFETIYIAEDPVTALAEVSGVLLAGGSATPLLNLPCVTITVNGRLLSVLDLSDPGIQAKLGTNSQELTGEWRYTQATGIEAPTQLLGRVCHRTRLFDAIRYPSSKNPPLGRCLAVFPDRLKSAAFLEVYDPTGHLAQRLPRGQR